jgi:hypothetical protein
VQQHGFGPFGSGRLCGCRASNGASRRREAQGENGLWDLQVSPNWTILRKLGTLKLLDADKNVGFGKLDAMKQSHSAIAV